MAIATPSHPHTHLHAEHGSGCLPLGQDLDFVAPNIYK